MVVLNAPVVPLYAKCGRDLRGPYYCRIAVNLTFDEMANKKKLVVNFTVKYI
jgi:hypothetical protein